MKISSYLKLGSFLVTIAALAFPLNDLFGQCYIVASQEHKRKMWEIWGSTVPDRQGNFATYDECVEFLNSAIDFDPVQRSQHWCECEGTNNSGLDNTQGQTKSNIQIEDHQTQLKKLKAAAYKKEMEKKNSDRQNVEDIKQDLSGKLKKNKSLDQLKITSSLSEKGEQDVNNNQTDKGRESSESAFTEAQLKRNRGDQNSNQVTVSQPVFIETQKNLFNYIDNETKRVQSKIIAVQQEKTKVLEKKIQIQENVSEQKLNVEKLNITKLNTKDEQEIEGVDSLLLLANQMLDESIEQYEKADKDLEEINSQLRENEELLNRYDETYNKSKEHPEESEQLLKELKGKK